MIDNKICPNDIEEIYQGEELYIGGCVKDDDGDAFDISDTLIVAQITSRNGYRKIYSSEEGGRIIKEPDTGVFSFVIPKDETSKMRGLYFIAISIDVNGESLMSDQYKAFEVKISSISK